jgi:hypothetical protein
MMRSVLGVLFGVVVWMVGFFVLAQALALLWPDYAIHGRQWIRQGVFTFTPLMACLNLLFWVLAETRGDLSVRPASSPLLVPLPMVVQPRGRHSRGCRRVMGWPAGKRAPRSSTPCARYSGLDRVGCHR